MTDLCWSVTWETDLHDAAHPGLAALLTRAYAGEAHRFAGGRSWAGARPEVRVVGRRDGTPIAHAGVVRRFLRALPDPGHGADEHVLVGDVGLVAVHPDHHGRGLGRALLARVVDLLTDLGVPFGFLSCGPDVEGFYRAAGWTRLAGVTVRTITLDHATVADRDPAMVHAAARPLAAWPSARVLARDGRLV